MEKVLRIDSITGKAEVVAVKLTEDEAKRLVKKLSAEDDFGIYYRVR